MKWRVLVWVAGLVAVTAAVMLGVVAVTAGLAVASGLAGVVVGFCELVAAMLAVVAWVGERRSATGAVKEGKGASVPSDRKPGPGRDLGLSHGAAKYAVKVGDDAQGLLIGDGNVQNIGVRRSRRDRARPETGESR